MTGAAPFLNLFENGCKFQVGICQHPVSGKLLPIMVNRSVCNSANRERGRGQVVLHGHLREYQTSTTSEVGIKCLASGLVYVGFHS